MSELRLAVDELELIVAKALDTADLLRYVCSVVEPGVKKISRQWKLQIAQNADVVLLLSMGNA